MRWVGVDVGGTFTDVVVYDEASAQLEVGKSPTTPTEPSTGLLNALGKLKVDLAETRRIVHGTTIATNAVLERTGAAVWMLVTRGFRDTLEIGRTNRTVLYDIRARKPAPLVARQHAVEIDERIAFDGAVRRPLHEDEVREAVLCIRDAAEPGVPAALVIAFVNSYVNPAHEAAAARIATALLPGWFVCTSAEVLPEIREYERFSTVALNAYVGPKVGGYLTALSSRLQGGGYGGEVFVTTSSGGIMPAAVAARFPVHTVLSGPAGGVAAAVNLGRIAGRPNLITYDMGGTSTDVCLIEDLEPSLTTEQHIAGLPNRTPQIEINSIGAGGGSVAWIDAGQALRVGPRSAGAAPGPACYGRGGTEPTITDANVVLGRIGTDVPLAGEVALDAGRARRALATLLGALPGIPDERALADGIIRIAVAKMVGAIKEISIAKGHDPRDFSLVAYGGAGPLHAAFIAEELEMPRVIVPTAPGNFSAFGALISDLRRDYVRTRLLPTRGASVADVEAVFAALERDAREDLAAAGIAPEGMTLVRTLGMRYVGQSWELVVRAPDAVRDMRVFDQAFHEAHERRYGHAGARDVEIVTFRVAGIGAIPKPAAPSWPPGRTIDRARLGTRSVTFGNETLETTVYQREHIPLAATVPAPAVVQDMGSTTVIPPGWSATVGPAGELVLERRSL